MWSSLIQGAEGFHEEAVYMCVCVCVCGVCPLPPFLTPSNKIAQGMAIGASDMHSHKLILVFKILQGCKSHIKSSKEIGSPLEENAGGPRSGFTKCVGWKQAGALQPGSWCGV